MMRGKVICYWIVVLCGIAHHVWASAGARYSAGSSTRATPDYSSLGEMTCKKSEGTFETLVKNAAVAKDSVYNSAWSGTRKDLEAIVKKAEQNYGFENSKHLGRNATMLVPATLAEMRKEIELGNPNHWEDSSFDGAHGGNANSDDNLAEMYWKKYNNGVSKFIIPEKRGNVFNKELNEDKGREVVYDNVTGKIIPNEKMGTWNFGSKNGLISALWGEHRTKDMDPHATKADKVNQFEKDGDQYKYVGILYERDSNDPEKYYIIDGQTGLPMTPQRVAEMPTTLSDMWKDMGLACVANDAEDIIPAEEESAEKSKNKDEQEDNTDVSQFSIDTSKLEALTKKMIAFAQSLLDAGKKATDSQISTYNSYADEARRELARLLRPILALPISDAEKQNIFKEKIEKKLKVLIERHQALQKQLVSRGLVGGLRPMSLDDLSHLGTKQSRDDGDKCVCPNPDYKATIPPAGPGWATCTKCGKSLGTILNGRFISTNPAVNGKPVK